MIHHTVAVVTAISPGCMQTKHHLVPALVLAQVLWQACRVALGQPLELLHHLLSLVHGVETMDPKHNLDLHFQGQHVAKRLVLGIDQPSAVHDDSTKHEMGPLRSVPPYSSVPWTNPPLAPGPGVQTKKVYPWGVPPRVSSRVQSPHVMSLHQSAPLVDSLNHVARPVLAHSALFSVSVQHGEFTPSPGVVLRTHRDPV